MELPESIQQLVERLGEAIVQALARDTESREIARQIQDAGYDAALMVEATIALHQRDAGEAAEPTALRTRIQTEALGEEETQSQWSEEDRAFLRTFKISLD